MGRPSPKHWSRVSEVGSAGRSLLSPGFISLCRRTDCTFQSLGDATSAKIEESTEI